MGLQQSTSCHWFSAPSPEHEGEPLIGLSMIEHASVVFPVVQHLECTVEETISWGCPRRPQTGCTRTTAASRGIAAVPAKIGLPSAPPGWRTAPRHVHHHTHHALHDITWQRTFVMWSGIRVPGTTRVLKNFNLRIVQSRSEMEKIGSIEVFTHPNFTKHGKMSPNQFLHFC